MLGNSQLSLSQLNKSRCLVRKGNFHSQATQAGSSHSQVHFRANFQPLTNSLTICRTSELSTNGEVAVRSRRENQQKLTVPWRGLHTPAPPGFQNLGSCTHMFNQERALTEKFAALTHKLIRKLSLTRELPIRSSLLSLTSSRSGASSG